MLETYFFLFMKKCVFFVRLLGYVSMWPRFCVFVFFLSVCLRSCVFAFLSLISFHISPMKRKAARIWTSMWHLLSFFVMRLKPMFDWLLRSFFFISLGDHVAISTQRTLFFLSFFFFFYSFSRFLFVKRKERNASHSLWKWRISNFISLWFLIWIDTNFVHYFAVIEKQYPNGVKEWINRDTQIDT